MDSNWTIVGAPFEWAGSSPLIRAKPIIQDKAGALFKVIGYSGDNVEVEDLEGDVEALQKQGLCIIPPEPLFKSAEVWLLRSHFPFLDDAVNDVISAKVLEQGPFLTAGGACFVVNHSSVTENLLTEWCDRASDEAIDAESKAIGENADKFHSLAMNCASISFSLCNAPSKSGLYLAILELAGRTEWYGRTSTMIEQSRGFHYFQSTMNNKNSVLLKVYKRRSEHLESLLKATSLE
jgi:hypothetical protein